MRDVVHELDFVQTFFDAFDQGLCFFVAGSWWHK